MTKEVQFRRGTTTQHSTFTGALAEVTVDTDKKVVVVHDGVTAGGQEMVGRTATQTLTNKTLTSPAINGGTINNASVGATTRSSGAFTTLDANGNVILGSDSSDTVTINGIVNSNLVLGTGVQIQGPGTLVIDPATVGDDTGTVQIKGNLEVLGTTTTIDSTTVTFNDPLIVLGDGQTTSATVDTGGFTLGTTGISIQYNHANSRFNCTEDFHLANGKAYEINGTVVLSSSAVLGKTIGGTNTGDIVSIDGTQTLSGKTLTAPRFVDTGFIADSNGNELLEFGVTANAVNEVKITNAATGTTGPLIQSFGETNVDLRLSGNGTGDIVIVNDSALKPLAGTTSKAPIQFTVGSLLTTATAGAFEYDGTQFYLTNADTANGKKYVETLNRYQVTANNTAITGTAIIDAFPATSSFPFLAGAYYEIEYHMYWIRTTTAGTHTYTLVSTQNWQYAALSSQGLQNAGVVGQHVSSSNAASLALPASASMAIGNHYHVVKSYFLANATTAGNIRLRVTSSANGITLQRGSFYTVRRLPAGSIGTFVA
jgi:hypothetical protein